MTPKPTFNVRRWGNWISYFKSDDFPLEKRVAALEERFARLDAIAGEVAEACDQDNFTTRPPDADSLRERRGRDSNPQSG